MLLYPIGQRPIFQNSLVAVIEGGHFFKDHKHKAMTRSEIEIIVGNHLANKLDLERAVKETDLLKEDLDMDSLDQVELIMDMEKEFKINLPDEEAAEVHTVGQMIDLITKYKSNV